jgi:hypothetical protein
MCKVLKALTRQKLSKKYCPKYGSPEIRLSSGSGYWLGLLKYVFTKFGYSGPVVMELEKEDG